jgi:hypothetical protein
MSSYIHNTADMALSPLPTDNKNDHEHIDNFKEDQHAPELRAAVDDLSVWQAVKLYKRASLFCMLAAFSAACDGFQGHFNGSIVANKGQSSCSVRYVIY